MTLEIESLREALFDGWPDALLRADEIAVSRAPGRVNLIGEHTDYNEGFVMPAAIDLETRICFVPSGDRTVRLKRLDTGDSGEFSLDAIGPPRGHWIDYVAGIATILTERGVRVHGIRGVIASTVPISSGLSSSAAIELAAAWALTEESPPPLPAMELVLAAQRAENRYVGVQSGLMDQFAVAFGDPACALLLDCRSLEYRAVPLPVGEAVLVVCDSHAPRELAGSAYNERRAECDRAVAVLQGVGRPVRALRDVDMALLGTVREKLGEVVFRRCEHVIRENDRVLATEQAMAAGDLGAVGRLWAESHASLRDLYEVSSPELDALVEIAAATPGVLAARMTGAGFGGCTVNLVAPDAVESLRAAVSREYGPRTGRSATVHVVRPARGAGMVSL